MRRARHRTPALRVAPPAGSSIFINFRSSCAGRMPLVSPVPQGLSQEQNGPSAPASPCSSPSSHPRHQQENEILQQVPALRKGGKKTEDDNGQKTDFKCGSSSRGYAAS
ncbi:hypothetical protein AV530_018571 [Patagioenas fasciata monilis]|uniref:Uncharacterized protein n=1 Tax=Patagioenas fasciata monilis TaxID=372326 RepID=A0A1V4JSP0_PATFA|nr:hypothetical protein AV530_018571 [Patagioenas fasciata monilis]